MKIYTNRESEEYLNELLKRMSVDELKRTAINIKEPFEVEGQEFSRVIRIDYLGISATTLFDVGKNYAKHNVYNQILELLRSVKKLNEEGIFIRFRILLDYPYSISAYSRIQAEVSVNRSSIDEPEFLRDFKLVEQIDERMFNSSSFVTAQMQTLDRIQELIDGRENDSYLNSSLPNRIMVRFTPIAPSICCLIINDVVFYDAYLLAKKNRFERVCTPLFSPIIQINREDGEFYLAFEDNFRYLWELDVTMDYEDATYYQKGKPHTMSKIKKPSEVFFEEKARNILKYNPKLTIEEAHQWKSCAHRVLDRFCANLLPTPGSDSLFLACSWTKGASGQSRPNKNAIELSNMLQDDFSLGRDSKIPLMSVHIMEAVTTDFLSRQLYSTLNAATIGLILLTKDIQTNDGMWLSKPNVYHELGYLLHKFGIERLIIIAEDKKLITANIHDIPYKIFERNKISLLYPEIVQWLKSVCRLNKKIIREIFEGHEKRLQKLVMNETITPEERKKTIIKMNDILNEM